MKLVRTIGLVLVVSMLSMTVVGPAMAQTTAENEKARIEADKYRSVLGGPAWGAGIGAGLIIIGASLGFGKIGAAALESMARQPETAGRVQTAMIIIGALLEGATFFALVVCFQLK